MIIQSLCDLLIDKNVITEEELNARLVENSQNVNKFLDNLHKEESDESFTFDINNYYGIIGES